MAIAYETTGARRRAVRSRLRVSCVALAAMFVPLAAGAAASARVDVNGMTVVSLSQTGVSFTDFERGVTLPGGQTVVREYDWSIFVGDDGRPGEFEAFGRPFVDPNSCLPLRPPLCGLPPTGFEQMRGLLWIGFTDRPNLPPNAVSVEVIGESLIDVRTSPGAFADSLTRTGHTTVRLTNNLGGTLTYPSISFASVWGYAVPDHVSPIPEPGTYALMLAGMGLLVGRRLTRREAPRATRGL